MIKLNILTMNTSNSDLSVNHIAVKLEEVQCVLEGGLGFLNYMAKML